MLVYVSMSKQDVTPSSAQSSDLFEFSRVSPPGSILAKDSLSSLLFLVEGHVPHADHSPEKYHTALQHHHDIEDALTPAAAHEASGATEKMPDELPFELILSPTIEVEFDFRAAQDKAEDDEVREDKARNAEQMEMLASQPT